jgi:hypothetical protein
MASCSRFVVACLLFFLVVVGPLPALSAEWKVVDRDFATIAMSCSFQTAESGWVVGGTSSLEPLVLNTTDAGKTFSNAGVANVSEGAFMSVRMADANSGIAGSLGFMGLICGAYTNDGQTWHRSHEGKDLLCAAQGAAAPNDQTFILVGQWTSGKEPKGNGVQISTDGGPNWSGQDWNQGTDARYAWFESADFGYVAGGTWPENETDPFSLPKKLSKHLVFTGKSVELVRHRNNKRLPGQPTPPGYQGLIAKATSAASSWTTLVNLTNQGLYFNQISCTDQNNCWAACEGNNITNGAVAAWVFATSNGWQSYTTQLYFEGGSLTAIQMLSPTFGWAAGALLPTNEQEEFKGAFFQTTDGQT